MVERVGQADHLHSVWGSSCLHSDVLTVSNIKPFFYVFVLMDHLKKNPFNVLKAPRKFSWVGRRGINDIAQPVSGPWYC